MKKWLIILLVLSMTRTYGQNEFASTSFNDDFRKIYADAQAGFIQFKGARIKKQLTEFAEQYDVKLLFPLADSGRIFIPYGANPFAVYYFEPEKRKEKIDKLAANLMQAVFTAFGKSLYLRTETSAIEDHFQSNSYYFVNSNETQSTLAVFKSSIYYFNKRYYLSFEIRGKAR